MLNVRSATPFSAPARVILWSDALEVWEDRELTTFGSTRLTADLECQSATCTVVQGDVSVRVDIDAIVTAVDGKIGGVVSAAMGLYIVEPLPCFRCIPFYRRG